MAERAMPAPDPANSPACYDARGSEAFDSAGVDVTLIDWMLSRSPLERLEALFIAASSAAQLSPSADSDQKS